MNRLKIQQYGSMPDAVAVSLENDTPIRGLQLVLKVPLFMQVSFSERTARTANVPFWAYHQLGEELRFIAACWGASDSIQPGVGPVVVFRGPGLAQWHAKIEQINVGGLRTKALNPDNVEIPLTFSL